MHQVVVHFLVEAKIDRKTVNNTHIEYRKRLE